MKRVTLFSIAVLLASLLAPSARADGSGRLELVYRQLMADGAPTDSVISVVTPGGHDLAIPANLSVQGGGGYTHSPANGGQGVARLKLQGEFSAPVIEGDEQQFKGTPARVGGLWVGPAVRLKLDAVPAAGKTPTSVRHDLEVGGLSLVRAKVGGGLWDERAEIDLTPKGTPQAQQQQRQTQEPICDGKPCNYGMWKVDGALGSISFVSRGNPTVSTFVQALKGSAASAAVSYKTPDGRYDVCAAAAVSALLPVGSSDVAGQAISGKPAAGMDLKACAGVTVLGLGRFGYEASVSASKFQTGEKSGASTLAISQTASLKRIAYSPVSAGVTYETEHFSNTGAGVASDQTIKTMLGTLEYEF